MPPITRRRAQSSLEKAMYAWMAESCNSEGWSDLFSGVFSEETTDYMAQAAWAVLEAIDNAQRYAVNEGYLKP